MARIRLWFRVSATAAMLMLATAVVSSARAETLLERGAYLMNGVAGCGNCHSPFGPNGPIDPELSGGPAIVTPVFTAHPPNITPDIPCSPENPKILR